MAAKRIKLEEETNKFNINKNASSIRLTKIVCTIGPTSRNVEILQEMILAGMDIARLNFSHGTHSYHAESIGNVRKACSILSKKMDKVISVAIALDTTGTEIRTGLLEGGGTAEVELKTGNTIFLTSNKTYIDKSNENILYVGYPNIEKEIKTGTNILIDDGLISLTCTSLEKGFLKCVINNGGLLGSRKGIYFNNLIVNLPIISQKDKLDINFGIEQGVDMIFASFMRSADAFREIREFMGERGKSIKLFSKIENRIGLNNMDEIIDISDGIMIDRGDLGTEIPLEKVFVAQKTIVKKCNKTGTPVIIATQLLESMISMPKPSRADVSDIANAVLDGADCVMLSGETAKGSYPAECVKVMDNVCKEAEMLICPQTFFLELLRSFQSTSLFDPTNLIAIASVQASIHSSASAIIVLTKTGRSAKIIAKYRPNCPILAVTSNTQTANQTMSYRGIIPIAYQDKPISNWDEDVQSRIQHALNYGKKWFLKEGDYVIIVRGSTKDGITDTTRILQL